MKFRFNTTGTEGITNVAEKNGMTFDQLFEKSLKKWLHWDCNNEITLEVDTELETCTVITRDQLDREWDDEMSDIVKNVKTTKLHEIDQEVLDKLKERDNA